MLRTFYYFLPFRFHMVIKWGHRLPERSCARSHRFCYRSVAQHCLLMVSIQNINDLHNYSLPLFVQRTYRTCVALKFKVHRMRSFEALSLSVILKLAQRLVRLLSLMALVKEEWSFSSEISFRAAPSAWLRFCGAIQGIRICEPCGYGAIQLSTNSFSVSWILFSNPIPTY